MGAPTFLIASIPNANLAIASDEGKIRGSSVCIANCSVGYRDDCGIQGSKPVVVVIDGLDECDRTRLIETAQMFSGLFKTLRFPSAKVFIASRTDDGTRKPFSMVYNEEFVKHVHLDTADESSIRDVSTFITRKIEQVVEIHDLDWEEWPGERRMETLCNRASGLFIWAVTAVKFIQEQIEAMGTECLNQVMDGLSIDGMGDINILYGTILHLTYRKLDDWAYETFRRIVTEREPLSIGAIRELLDLRKTKESDPVDIKHFVRRLRTVLVAGADTVDETTFTSRPSSTSPAIVPRGFVSVLTSQMANSSHIAYTVSLVSTITFQKCHKSNTRTRHR